MAPMATAAAVDSDSAHRRDAERDPDERELAVAGAEVEAEDLGQDGGEGGPVGDLAARSDRVAERVDEPDTGPARLPDAREVRRHRASASVPRGRSRRRRPGAATSRPSG